MIFLAMLLFLFSIWVLPWWGVWLAAVGLGYLLPGGGKRTLHVAVAAALASMAVAFLLDGKNQGMISMRMNAMFFLPFSGAIFLLLGVLAAVSAALGYRLGAALGEWRLSQKS